MGASELPLDPLTDREREVLDLVQRGLNNEAIARELGITRDAVRYHLKEIHSKLGTGGERSLLRGGRETPQRRLGGWIVGSFAAKAATAGVLGILGLAGFGVFQAFPRDEEEQHCATRVISVQEALALGDVRLASTPQRLVCASKPEDLAQRLREIEAAGGLPLVYPTPGPPRTYGTPPAR